MPLFVNLTVEDRSGQVVGIFEIAQQQVIIGRSQAADIVLDAPEVSRRHARLLIENGQVEVEDLESLGGTRVDQHPVTRERVPLGSSIQIGTFTLTIARGDVPVSYLDQKVRVLTSSSQVRLNVVGNERHTVLVRRDGQAAVAPGGEEHPLQNVTLVGVSHGNPIASLADRYHFVKHLNSGGSGQVFLVQELLSRRFVALKTLHAELAQNPTMVQQFILEAIIAARFQHPHVLPVHDLGFLEHKQLYYTMRYVEGPTFDSLLSDQSPSAQLRAARLIGQAASAVAMAHNQNLMHLDLKPDNILVDGNDHCYVLDWGLVREIPGRHYTFEIPRVVVPRTEFVSQSVPGFTPRPRVLDDAAFEATMTAVCRDMGRLIVGTKRYMAPNQARGEPSWSSDVWSLGLMLFEALTGQHPYQIMGIGRSITAIQEVKRMPGITDLGPVTFPALAGICQRALDPAFRDTPTMREFAQVVRQAVKQGWGRTGQGDNHLPPPPSRAAAGRDRTDPPREVAITAITERIPLRPPTGTAPLKSVVAEDRSVDWRSEARRTITAIVGWDNPDTPEMEASSPTPSSTGGDFTLPPVVAHRRLELLGELATLPLFAFARRRRILDELRRLG